MKIIIVLLCLMCVGCAPTIVLHPIDKEDIVELKKGESFIVPKDGYFLSKFYVQEVMEAKVN